jgi:hypothetical protein
MKFMRGVPRRRTRPRISVRSRKPAMQRLRVRLEIRGIMAAVAVSALLFWVYRVVPPGDGVVSAGVPPGVGVELILGSTLVLACKRYSDALAQPVNAKMVTTRSQKIRLLMTSLTIAATLIGLSDFAFLVGYYAYSECLDGFFHTYTTNTHGPERQGYLIAMFCGLIMAMTVAYALRRLIWPIVEKPPAPATSPSAD